MLTKNEIEKIRSVLSGRRGVAYAILFGSAVKHLLAHSDIDLLIGGDLDPSQKTYLTDALALELRRPIDIVLIKDARCDLALRAFSSGIPVAIRDKGKVKEDYLNCYRLCDQERLARNVRL